MDEHRLGLKPILGKLWAPRGKRPIVRVQHRYEWLYLYAFACPESGSSQYWLLPEVNTPAFQLVLDAFARSTGAGPNKRVLLVLDNAGWHNCRVQWGSLWDCDLSQYDVVFAYLSPVPMEKLWHKARAEMRPGTIFISSTFTVLDQAHHETVQVDDLHHSTLFIWHM